MGGCFGGKALCQHLLQSIRGTGALETAPIQDGGQFLVVSVVLRWQLPLEG